jgi:hypothetical protein
MIVQTTYGPVWVSDQAPYYRDWAGRQAYKYLYAGRKRPQAAPSS